MPAPHLVRVTGSGFAALDAPVLDAATRARLVAELVADGADADASALRDRPAKELASAPTYIVAVHYVGG